MPFIESRLQLNCSTETFKCIFIFLNLFKQESSKEKTLMIVVFQFIILLQTRNSFIILLEFNIGSGLIENSILKFGLQLERMCELFSSLLVIFQIVIGNSQIEISPWIFGVLLNSMLIRENSFVESNYRIFQNKEPFQICVGDSLLEIRAR